ncbi:MAG: putative nucleotidyltransferase [Acidobacteria bacterium OLB17]|nr:MAG: putative nucleotidyltransferase [Acidobacteria bacterium OLB17]MCZ2391966.1 nucleotidyltransferase family protein [Acidobacteriota bacterium]
MDLEPVLNKLRQLCDVKDVAMLGVFGSAARGEDTADSDIDLLVRLGRPVGFVEFIALEDTFKEIFGRNVDLATEASLHPLIRKNVLADLKVIYER